MRVGTASGRLVLETHDVVLVLETHRVVLVPGTHHVVPALHGLCPATAASFWGMSRVFQRTRRRRKFSRLDRSCFTRFTAG